MAPEPTATPASANNAPGRCFVCLSDQEPSDDWVKPCPCSVEGHHDCLLMFINELDRERKAYQCPVCKTKFNVQQPLGALVPIHDTIYKTFARLSPAVLGLGSLGGTLVGLSAYGVLAVRAFAGQEATQRFLKQQGWDWHFLLLPTVAPVMVLSQSLPEISRRIINPIAFAYSIGLSLYDDEFFSAAPSPRAALCAIPYIQQIYRGLWDVFIRPHEARFERKAAGLPDPPPRRERRQGQRGAQRGPQRDRGGAGGGLVGLLDIAIELLDIPDVDIEFEIQQEDMAEDHHHHHNHDHNHNHIAFNAQGGAGAEAERLVLEEQLAHLEEVLEQQEALLEQQEQEAAEEEDDDVEEVDEDNDTDDEMPLLIDPMIEVEIAAPAPVVQPAAPPPEPAAQPAGNNVHWDLGTALLGLSSAITADLLLPVFAAASGELLRLVLPKRFTTMPSANFTGRVGLLQQVWGRSLAGGALYVVFRDFFRLYVKYRKADAKSYRRVQNFDRKKAAKTERQAPTRP